MRTAMLIVVVAADIALVAAVNTEYTDCSMTGAVEPLADLLAPVEAARPAGSAGLPAVLAPKWSRINSTGWCCA